MHHHHRVNLSVEHTMFFEILEGIFVLANFFAKVSNGSFHGPLCITCKWTCVDSLRSNVSQEMDAVMNEMDARFHLLVVKLLKFLDKVFESCIPMLESLWSNFGTLKCLNTCNQLAVIFPIFLWKDVSK
jgi:hypothetical protein